MNKTLPVIDSRRLIARTAHLRVQVSWLERYAAELAADVRRAGGTR